MGIEHGYCHCGCGERTKLAFQTNKRYGHIKGEPLRFINGHNTRWGEGENNRNWKGGRITKKIGNTRYAFVRTSEYPRSRSDGYISEHILICEQALGFPIGRESVVHHIDGNGLNNTLSNLMVFKDSAEHLKFHALQRGKV